MGGRNAGRRVRRVGWAVSPTVVGGGAGAWWADCPPYACYKWGGIIDTSARTTFFSGTTFGGRLAYAMGFTGQGVSASRFAALTMLDLLDGVKTVRTELSMHRRWPVPFPPEPFRAMAVRMAQKRLAHEDRTGHRPLFLRALDAFGIGFNS